MDGVVPEGVDAEDQVKEENIERGPSFVIKSKLKVPREFQITKKDADKFGITNGCSGCMSWYRALARQPHSGVCRERFRNLMKNEAKVKITS